ncbi:choice-of-anchor V domain-containing protein [Hyphococcus sp.]|uniref:choice-of-anchor V domain-containing protein n=1 Tax=Hyphococcus sp. TaxID=2038636 RepID=UPI00207EACDA|nr:MAG: hypothetical protein DHS20C04_27090 [Marinicaulis sp.]
MRGFYAFFAAGLALTGPASAYPNGAPWGSANPDAANSCNSCHFDGDVVMESDLISMTGWEPLVGPGDQFELRLMFKKSKTDTTVGMQVSANVGSFQGEQDGLETLGSQIRSTAAKGGSGWLVWRFKWTAPAKMDAPITFHIAVNESNDDLSALGDQIHLRTLTLYAE